MAGAAGRADYYAAGKQQVKLAKAARHAGGTIDHF
jgi:hypothetical protein